MPGPLMFRIVLLQASVEQATTGLLPARHFQHLVLCASEPEAQQALEPFLASCPFPQHLLRVEVGSLDAPPPAPSAVVPRPAAVGAAAAGTGGPLHASGRSGPPG